MIIDIIAVLILITGFMQGFKRGLVYELFNLIGYIGSFIFAHFMYGVIMDWITQQYGMPFGASGMRLFRPLLFAILFSLFWKLVRIIKDIVKPITKLPIISQLNDLLGGLLSLVSRLVIIIVVINILTVIPNRPVRNNLEQSIVAHRVLSRINIFESFNGQL